jgi:hypothetical protein
MSESGSRPPLLSWHSLENQTKLGAFLSYLDDSELEELVDQRLAWSELYQNGGDG